MEKMSLSLLQSVIERLGDTTQFPGRETKKVEGIKEANLGGLVFLDHRFGGKYSIRMKAIR